LRAGEGSQEGSAVEEGKGERRVWREGELTKEMGHSHSVETAFDAQTDTSLETIPGVLVVVEVFIVSSESEPGSGKPIPSSRFVVSERSSWVMGDEGGESTSGLKEGAESDGFCDVRGRFWSCGDVGGRDGEGSSDLEDERDSDVCERFEDWAV
jgi:hypothetical protein